MDAWVIAKCRQVSLHRAILFVALGLAVAAIGFLGAKTYLLNFFEGPYPATEQDLARLRKAEDTDRYYVRVAGSSVFDTGIQQIEEEEILGFPIKVKWRFYLLSMGEHFLLVRAAATPGNMIEGRISPVLPEAWNLLFSNPEEKRNISPFIFPLMVTTEHFRLPGYLGLFVAAIVLTVLSCFAAKAWKQFQDPSDLPVVSKIVLWGDFNGKSMEIEREVSHGCRLKTGSVYFTDHYAVRSSILQFDVFRLDDLLWAYKQSLRHGLWVTHTAICFSKEGNFTITRGEGDIDRIMAYLHKTIPWAVFGRSQEIARDFAKNPAAFAETVAERKRLWEQQKLTEQRPLFNLAAFD